MSESSNGAGGLVEIVPCFDLIPCTGGRAVLLKLGAKKIVLDEVKARLRCGLQDLLRLKEGGWQKSSVGRVKAGVFA